jgi:hypothetical protein
MRILFLVPVLAFALAAPLRADEAEEPQPHTDEQMEEYQVLETFEERFDSDDMDDRILAVRNLGRWIHKDVLKVLEGIFRRDRSLELRAAAAMGLGNQTPFARKAGRTLVRGLQRMEDFATREEPEGDEELEQRLEADVLVQALTAIGNLGYKDAWDDIEHFIGHPHDDVAAAMMLACGQMKEYRALKPILEWFNFYPDGHSWTGGSVRVDTGAAGNRDARAARAKWMSLYGGRARRARPRVWEQMVEAVEMLTGEEMSKPEELEAWMEENEQLLRRHGA